MLRWVLFLALFCVGCVHPELIGFPPTGGADPSPSQPSNTDTSDEPADASLLRARFTTRASLAEINRTACTLKPSIVVDGRHRKIAMHIGGVTPCEPPSEGSLRVNISTFDADGGARTVVVELVTADAAATELPDLRAGLRDTARELARRIAAAQRANESFDQTEAPPKGVPKEKHYPSARVLMVSGILWACTVGTAGVAGLMLAGAAAESSGNGLGWAVAAVVTMMFGAAPLALAALTTLIVAGGLYAGEDHGP